MMETFLGTKERNITCANRAEKKLRGTETLTETGNVCS